MSEPKGAEMENKSEQEVDDRGTTQAEGRELLKRLRDNGFESSDAKLAVALGRPIEQVEAWTGGTEPVDDDVIMKARGIAQDRNIEID